MGLGHFVVWGKLLKFVVLILRKNLQMKNIVTRALSGLVYVALSVGAILLGKYAFWGLVALLCVLAVPEFQHVLRGPATTRWRKAIVAIDCAVCVAMATIPALAGASLDVAIGCSIFVFMYTIIRFTLALYDKEKDAFSDCARSALTVMYIGLPMAALSFLYNDNLDNWQLVLAMFAMIWLNDTGAYCVGSMLGKHRLFERLSPKKSWEGFWGGFAFCLLAGWGCHWLMPDMFSLIGWLGFGAMVSVFSTWGDLFESLLKRSHAVKDSGHLIPGHGGILDRIDSLLFVAPMSLLFFILFN